MSRWTSPRRTAALSDEALVSLARAGDPEAFAAIVARYHGPLLGMARRLGAEQRAEDLVQQTFLSALVAFRSGTEVWHLRGWLHQILRHTAARRRPNPAEVTLDDDHAASAITVEDTVERRLAARQVLSAMAALPDRQRDAMVATALEGRSRSAIAATMGLSEGAVRQLTHRARQTLRAAAYSWLPWPVLRWFARGGSDLTGDSPSVVAAATSSPLPGVAAKLAAVVVSGALATGYLTPGPVTNLKPPHRPASHVRAGGRPTGGSVVADGRRAQLAAAVTGPDPRRVEREPHDHGERRAQRRDGNGGSSGRRVDGGGDRDSGSAAGPDGGRSDAGAPSVASAGEEGGGRNDGTASASGTDSASGPDSTSEPVSTSGPDPTSGPDSASGPGSSSEPVSTTASGDGNSTPSNTGGSGQSGSDGGPGPTSSGDRDLLAGTASSTP